MQKKRNASNYDLLKFFKKKIKPWRLLVIQYLILLNQLNQKAPGAIWCPCFNHSLNLSIAKGCQIQSTRNAFGPIKEIVHFFNSIKT